MLYYYYFPYAAYKSLTGYKNIYSHLRQNHIALLTFARIHCWCFLMVHLPVKLGDRHQAYRLFNIKLTIQEPCL